MRTRFTPTKISSLLCLLLIGGLSSTRQAAAAGWLHTSHTSILDASNNPWLGHGVVLPDPRDNEQCWQSTDASVPIQKMNIAVNWGANFIRIPLDSYDAIYNGQSTSDITSNAAYLQSIKQIVDSAATNHPDLYVYLSIWIDPTHKQPECGTCQYKGAKTSSQSGGYPTAAEDVVLQKLVDTFYSYSNVIFGLANEPEGGADPATIWTAMNHGVQTIRDREAYNGSNSHLVAVQGTNWSSDLSYYNSNPITAGNGVNVIYEYHVYDPSVITNVTTSSQYLPIFVGEYGPSDSTNANYDWEMYGCPSIGSNFSLTQVANFVNILRNNNIPYMAWSFDPCDGPNLLTVVNNGAYCSGCFSTATTYGATSWGNQVYNDLQTTWTTQGSGRTNTGGTTGSTTTGGTSSGGTGTSTTGGTNTGGTGSTTGTSTTGGSGGSTTGSSSTASGGSSTNAGTSNKGVVLSVPVMESVIFD